MVDEDPELAELRKKRITQMQSDQIAQKQQEEQLRQVEMQRQMILNLFCELFCIL